MPEYPPQQDEDDEATPAFWETVYRFATMGRDIKRPAVAELPPAPIGVQILELKERIAGPDTQLLPVITSGKTIFGQWSEG